MTELGSFFGQSLPIPRSIRQAAEQGAAPVLDEEGLQFADGRQVCGGVIAALGWVGLAGPIEVLETCPGETGWAPGKHRDGVREHEILRLALSAKIEVVAGGTV